MDENTTTEAVTQEQGVDETQPVEQQAEAEQTDHSEPNTNDDQGSTQEESASEDEPLEDWAKNKGLELDSENARKAAKMAREAEKGFHNKAQKASELEKQLSTPTGSDSDADRVARLEVIMQTRDFFDAHPEAKELEGDMAAYINSDKSGVRRELIKQGYLSLEEVHAIVSANPNRTSQLKAEGRTEGLQELANKQRATAVTGNAVNTAPAQKVTADNAEAWWESLGAEGRRNPENVAQLNRLLS